MQRHLSGRWHHLLLLTALIGCFLVSIPAAAQAPSETKATLTLPPPGTLWPVGEDVRTALRLIADGDLSAGLNALSIRASHKHIWSVLDDSGDTLAAASLHRALSQLDREECYNVLHQWTFPEQEPSTIRHWFSPAATVQPPAEFARLFGERPRANSFPVAAIHGVPGFFSTGWTMVLAAKECGQLRRLTAELQSHKEQQVPNAELLWLLAKAADEQTSDSEILTAWQELRASLPTLPSVNTHTPNADGTVTPGPTLEASFHAGEVLLALVTGPRSGLAEESESTLQRLMELNTANPCPILQPALTRAYAHVVLRHAGLQEIENVLSPHYRFWMAIACSDNPRTITGPPIWLTQEQAVVQLAGSGHSVLQSRFPMTGEFQFGTTFQSGGPYNVDAGLSYDGFTTLASARRVEFVAWDSQGAIRKKGSSIYLDAQFGNIYAQADVVHTPEETTFLINHHPMWRAPSNTASSWLELCASGDRRAVFRRPQISGTPLIPERVSMQSGSELTGWSAQVPGQPWSGAFTAQPATEFPLQEWMATEEEIRCESQADIVDQSGQAGWLRYQRPLQDDESWQYEFYYQPGQTEVHPALGRVVFLLLPDGVQLRWITEGANEWTGLPGDNSLIEPLNRRGPRELPLQADSWNRLRITRQQGTVTLTLNDQEIYRRPIDWDGDQRMGFYRDAAVQQVRVRQVQLQGRWSSEVLAEWQRNPLAIEESSRMPAQLQAINRLMTDECFASDVMGVLDETSQISPESQLEFLSNWVLPSETHATYRLWGAFTTTDPPGTPLATDPAVDRGGHLVSPVFEWLRLAKDQQQIERLRERLLAAPQPKWEIQQRCYWALRTLLALEAGDEEAATEDCLKLHALVKVYTPTGVDDQWPETICLFHAIPRFPKFGPLGDLLNTVYSQRTLQWRPASRNDWHHHLTRLVGEHQRATDPSQNQAAPPPMQTFDWIPGGMMKSATRGRGHPPAVWEFRPGEVRKVSGHDEDYVFYRLPLMGDFEIDAELSNPSRDPTQILIGGLYVGPRWTPEEVEVGTLVKSPKFLKIAPKFQSFGRWVHYRGVVRDSKLTTYLNGRVAYTIDLPQQRSPWIGFRAWGKQHGAIRNLRISGNPEIPGSVPLIVNADLNGWYSYHHDELIGEQNGAVWKYVQDPESSAVLHGRQRTDVADTWYESLLCYARPLISGEQLKYEFAYEPGETMVHPALDRLVFLLEPDGVKEHWLTDGRYDRTGTDPRNVIERPDYRRGPERLPLKATEWNQLRVQLVEQQVQLYLNEELIYERPVDPQRLQTFGLFRYSDQTESVVRNVTLSGDWQLQLPSLQNQLLAQTPQLEIDRRSPELTATFEHDFARHGIPRFYFKWPTPKAGISAQQRLIGLFVTAESEETWNFNEYKPRFSLQGDFDLEFTFDQLETPCEKDAGIILSVQLDDPQQTQYRIHRIKNSGSRQEIHISTSYVLPNNQRVYPSLEHIVCEAFRGRLRLSRRGDQIHFLFADNDSPLYRLLWTEAASTAPAGIDSIRLQAVSHGAGKSMSVWKSLRIAAEKLYFNPETTTAGPRGLYVMLPDGTDLRLTAIPANSGYQVVGSAEWSPDGTHLAVDMSNGSTSSSHILIMNADGSGIQDLGPGCMPSFSLDGQQLIFSDVNSGIMLMNRDGSDRTTIDGSGWGTQWSPDGKWIAYGKSGNIVLLEPRSKVTRMLLTGEQATRYSSIYWNLGWSHDSRTIGFKARRRDGGADEVAVIDIDKPDHLQVLLSSAQGVNPDITFSPQNDAIVVAIPTPRVKAPQLHIVRRAQPDQAVLLEKHPENLVVYDAHWSRDGKRIAFSGQELPGPIEWTPEKAAHQYDQIE